jgi:BlaI family penicillinase repressor
MKKDPHIELSRRERQIMDVIYRRGRATAAEVLEDIPDQPSYSTIRAKLKVLEDKGHVRHEEQDLRYVYLPTIPVDRAKRSALRHLLDTFFDGSAEQVVAALLDGSSTQLSNEELLRLSSIIENAKEQGEQK